MGARSEQLKGVRFGVYEIVRLVGHGATASVFEAIHIGLGKPVALKLLHEHLSADEQITSRFLREGRVAARLQHPHIVSVIDVGDDHGVPHLVMELLNGGDLRSLLASVGVLSVEHALAFLVPIASALAHAHDAGVIHRDLKPANIFLAEDEREGVVPKLVDFGLSKALHSGGESTSALTATELVAGTALYMAPEQTLGMKNASPKSDQYAWAAIAYEAMTGKPPFEGDGVYALLEHIRAGAIRPPSALNPKIGKPLEGLLLRAMSREPAERWSSMRTLGRELLPYAEEAVARTFERDFADRSSGRSSVASGPVLRASLPTPPEVITRIEQRATSEPLASGLERLPCAPGTSPFHIKGVSYRGFVFHIERAVGLDAFVAELEDERLRAFVRQPFLASTRYDVLPYVPLFATLARMQRVALDALVRASTAAQARYDARTTYRLILDSYNPADIAERIGRFNAQVYDFGTYAATVRDRNHVALEFSGIPAYLEPWFSPMHVSYAEESLRLAGAREVVVVSHVAENAGSHAGYPLRRYRTELGWQ